MASKKEEAQKQNPSFETAVQRLETIVEQMESDQLPLEELLVRYEEGIKLVKFCSEKLQAAEKRIEVITRDMGEKPKLADFDADEAVSAPSKPDEVRLF
jgi:exodeoxyribonuclease VII small subunit